MSSSPPPPAVVVSDEEQDDLVVGDRQTLLQVQQQQPAGGAGNAVHEGTKPITRACAVEEGERVEEENGPNGKPSSSTSTPTPTSTSSSPSTSNIIVHRARRREREYFGSITEPVPPIPLRFASYGSTSSSIANHDSNNNSNNNTNNTSTNNTTTPTLSRARSVTERKTHEQHLHQQHQYQHQRSRVGDSKSVGRDAPKHATGLVDKRPKLSRSKSLPRSLSSQQQQQQRYHSYPDHANHNPKMPRSVASDVFIELARENHPANANSNSTSNQFHNANVTFPAHRRSLSRSSFIDSSASSCSAKNKRHSFHADLHLLPRPMTSGGPSTGKMSSYPNRPSPRLQHVSRASTDLQRHMDQYSAGNRFPKDEDTTSQAVGRRRGFTSTADRTPFSPQSPEMPQYGRRRPSGVWSPHTHARKSQEDTLPASKTAESASSDSQSVDTVWDELDDLKSRIKKLELTGKLPTSSAAVSRDSSDRPRTATTAPTTIDSSPKQGRKQEQPPPHIMTMTAPSPSQPDTPTTPAGINVSTIHPLLHNALAKAKPLLNANLFRSLEATAADALQLAAMTGSAGPQGTTFSAASIINGVTVSDRHVRRKADNMCRNLTDLCLALCEGKHEAPSAPTLFSSPLTNEPLGLQRSPSLRYTRSGMGSSSTVRTASRLEARRSSILGSSSITSDISPRGSIGDMSSSYSQDQSPPQQSPSSYLQAPQRTNSRTPNLRLRSRLQSHGDVSGNETEEEEPTVRPLSRAMTEAGSFRRRVASESRTPAPVQDRQHRSSNSSLRDSILNARNHNDEVYEQNRHASEQPRYSSDSSRKRQSQLYNTPPTVTEEDDNTLRGTDFHTTLQSQRRRNMSGQYGSNRNATDGGRRLERRSERAGGEGGGSLYQRSGEGGGSLQQRRSTSGME